MTDTPTSVPSSITAGNSFSWLTSLSDYPASSGWSLIVVLINATSKITLTSEASTDDHLVSVSAATSAEYTAGKYKYTILVTDETYRYTVESGDIEVLPDPSTQTTFDGRTIAETCLENIEAVLEGKATQDNMSYSIGGRSLSKYSWDELITARNYFQTEVNSAKRKASGKTQSNLIKMRFV